MSCTVRSVLYCLVLSLYNKNKKKDSENSYDKYHFLSNKESAAHLKKKENQFILHHGAKGFLRNSKQRKDDLMLFNGTGSWRIVVCIHPCSDWPKALRSHIWCSRVSNPLIP